MFIVTAFESACFVTWLAVGQGSKEVTGQGREEPKHELPVLLTGRLYTEKQKWMYGTLEFGLCTTQLELQDKSQKQERK